MRRLSLPLPLSLLCVSPFLLLPSVSLSLCWYRASSDSTNQSDCDRGGLVAAGIGRRRGSSGCGGIGRNGRFLGLWAVVDLHLGRIFLGWLWASVLALLGIARRRRHRAPLVARAGSSCSNLARKKERPIRGWGRSLFRLLGWLSVTC